MKPDCCFHEDQPDGRRVRERQSCLHVDQTMRRSDGFECGLHDPCIGYGIGCTDSARQTSLPIFATSHLASGLEAGFHPPDDPVWALLQDHPLGNGLLVECADLDVAVK